jgi:predicted hydrocarbon binding protein
MTLRTVRISKEELLETRKIYENVMSYACYGLFFKEGEVLGKSISKIALKSAKGDRNKYFELAANLISGRGWVEKIEFGDDRVVASGSIEVEEGKGTQTCHILRGLIKNIYEEIDGERYSCDEDRCASKGDESCVFVLKKRGV